jgi:hypothetical protein
MESEQYLWQGQRTLRRSDFECPEWHLELAMQRNNCLSIHSTTTKHSLKMSSNFVDRNGIPLWCLILSFYYFEECSFSKAHWSFAFFFFRIALSYLLPTYSSIRWWVVLFLICKRFSYIQYKNPLFINICSKFLLALLHSPFNLLYCFIGKIFAFKILYSQICSSSPL